MSVEQQLPAFRQQVAAIANAMEQRARHVAHMTAQRVGAGIRARVRFATGQHLRNNVTVVEDTGGRQFAVGFRDATAGASGHPMMPVWHEFGTEKMAANPAVGDSVAAERSAYETQMRAALSDALQR